MTTLIVELTADAPHSVDALDERLHSDLLSLLEREGLVSGLRRCVLSTGAPDVELDNEARGWAAGPDAIVQLAFDDAAEAMSRIGGVAAVIESLDDTADTARTSAFIAEEVVIVDDLGEAGRWADAPENVGPPVKMVVQNWKRPDLSVEAFRRHWQHEHGPLVRRLRSSIGLTRYVQSHRVEISELDRISRSFGWRPSPNGGMTEAWWPSAEQMVSRLSSDEAAEAGPLFSADEAKFVNPSQMAGFYSHERLLIG